MKTLWILFTALALLAVAMPAIAEVTTGAVFYWYGITDLADATNGTANVLKARIKVAGDVDEFNKISTELRWNNGGNTWDPAAVKIKTFKLDTDITGALGLDLPVTLKSTVGVWESDFTGWWYATRAGWSFVGGFNQDEQAKGAAQLDIGIGPANIHYYQNMTFGTTMIGADAAFGPAGVWIAYKAEPQAFGDGALNAEIKYEGEFGDLALSVYPTVKYDLGASALGWNAGVKVGYKMLTVAAGAGGTDPDYFNLVEGELGAAFGNAALWVAFYDQFNVDKTYGVDFMASYKFGAATFYLGYALAGDGWTTQVPDPAKPGKFKYSAANALPIDGWEWDTRTGGLYLGVKASL